MNTHPDDNLDSLESFAKVETQAEREWNEGYDFDAQAELVAKERGQIVVYPADNQLQIDIDTDEQYDTFRRRFDDMQWLDTDWGRPSVREKYSKAGLPHRHITLTFRDGVVFDQWARIAIQCALGDDSVRVFLNVKRCLHGVQNPSRLFENP